MKTLRNLFRGSLLLVIFVALGLIGLGNILFDMLMSGFARLLRIPEPSSRGEDIITPLKDEELPAYLQPIVAIRREAALVKNYSGPIVWYFRGNVTLADIVAEFGHARVLKKIFGQQTDGIWPSQPMLVFWTPWEILTERGDGKLSILKKDCGLPNNHKVSRGRVLVIYLLLLRYHRFNGQSALPSGGWLETETVIGGHPVRIGYGDWGGYRIDLRGCADATGYYMLGMEHANNFSLKRAA